VLRPALGWRLTISAVSAAVVAGALVVLVRVVRGELEWTVTTTIGLPLLALVALGCLVGGLVGPWTARVWVDDERMELHQFVVVRDVARTLAPPGTARLEHTPATANTAFPTWRLVLSQPGVPPMSVSTPWVSDLRDLLRLLQPALRRNPALAADERTRAAVEDPEGLTRP
jgi:hypothetical protein